MVRNSKHVINGPIRPRTMGQESEGYSNASFTDQESHNGIEDNEKPERYGCDLLEADVTGETGTSKQSISTEHIGLFRLFRYADTFDIFLMIVGSIGAIMHGLCHQANYLLYGDVITGFIYFEQIPDNLTEAYNMSLPFVVDDYIDVYGNTTRYAWYFCITGLVCIIAGTIQFVCWDISMERQMLKIRTSLFTSILHQDMEWFDVHGTGELGTGFTESMIQIEEGIGKQAATFIQWIASCLASYILAFVKGWKLTLACLSFTPLFLIAAGLLINWLKNLSVVESKAYAKAGSVVTEVLTAIKTVMSFNGQDKETRRYNTFLDTAKKMGIKKGLALGLGTGFAYFVSYCMFATSFGYGVQLSLDGEPGFEKPGNVILIYLAIVIGSLFLAQALPILEVFANAKAGAMKVFKIIDAKPTINISPSTGLKPKAIEGSIELRNVRFSYLSRKEVEVLKDISIHMKPGQNVAIVGHSGCGKSTIIQLIERFYDVSSGQILIDGVDVRKLDVSWLRNQIGLVSQEPVLFATTIRESIQCGRLDVSEQNIHDAARNANIHEFIQDLPEGYDTMVGQRGTQLSGGQKQRVAIARALVRDPRILLLDEATSALDNESEAVVQQALENAQKGRTTVVIAHRLSTIQNADLIVVMDNGKVIETGNHAELVAKAGVYADLVINQTEHSEEHEVITELQHGFSGVTREQGSHRNGEDTDMRSQTHTTGQKMINKEQAMDDESKGEEVSFQRLMRMNTPEWHYILGGSICATAVGALFPAVTILLSEYLRVFTKPVDEQIEYSLIMTAIIMTTAVLNTFLRIGQYVFLAVSGEALTSRLRKLTFKSFLKQDMAFFDDPKHQVSKLTTRLSADATLVQGATGSKIGYMLEAVACIISGVIVSFASSWRMTLVVLIFLPFMIFTGILNGRLMLGFEKANHALMDQATIFCSEAIDNVKLVASLTMEEHFRAKYVGTITTINRKAVKRCFLTSFLIGFSSSLIFFGYGASLTYGSYLMQNRLLSFYIVVRIFSTLLFGGQHIGRMSVQSGNFSKAAMAASRLFGLIDRVPAIDSSSECGETKAQLEGNISLQNVDFHYPFRTNVQVLKHLSLEVKAGETIALVGASGCGKSTTVSLLERFYDPSAGQVMVDGIDMNRVNLQWLRSQIGFVQQEPVLFDGSIAANIAYGANDRDVPMDEIIAVARSANIHSFINALPNGYETNVGTKGTQLSGGQKQRIAIARAIISNPRILLLDEATSALDSQSEQVVQEALDVARKGRTCIVIAHRLSTIQNADKIAIIHKGSVVEIGSHAELIAAKGIYYKFLNLHNSNEN